MNGIQGGRSYVIVSRPVNLGRGWKLTMFEDGKEAGGSVFRVPKENPEEGMDWWNSISESERAYWLLLVGSAVPADARQAYLLAMAYDAAMATGEDWATP